MSAQLKVLFIVSGTLLLNVNGLILIFKLILNRPVKTKFMRNLGWMLLFFILETIGIFLIRIEAILGL